MRTVTVSGLYRHNIPGHTEQGIKPYSVSFLANLQTDSPGVCIKNAAIILARKDSSFDSLKTHKVEFLPEPIPTPIEESPDDESSTEPVEPAGEDSGAQLFE